MTRLHCLGLILLLACGTKNLGSGSSAGGGSTSGATAGGGSSGSSSGTTAGGSSSGSSSGALAVAPTVALSGAEAAQIVSGNLDLTLDVTAGSSAITAVTLASGTHTFCTLTHAPYTCAVNTALLLDGVETLTAVATDANALTGSASLDVLVDNLPPTITTSTPANGSVFSTPSLTFTVTVIDSGSGVQHVDAFRGATWLGQIAQPPFTFADGATTAAGLYTYSVTATDNAGHMSTTTLSFTADHTAPHVIANNLTTASGGAWDYRRFYFQLDEPLDPSSLANVRICQTASPSTCLSDVRTGAYRSAAASAPDSFFVANTVAGDNYTNYTVDISGVSDVAGNPVAPTTDVTTYDFQWVNSNHLLIPVSATVGATTVPVSDTVATFPAGTTSTSVVTLAFPDNVHIADVLSCGMTTGGGCTGAVGTNDHTLVVTPTTGHWLTQTRDAAVLLVTFPDTHVGTVLLYFQHLGGVVSDAQARFVSQPVGAMGPFILRRAGTTDQSTGSHITVTSGGHVVPSTIAFSGDVFISPNAPLAPGPVTVDSTGFTDLNGTPLTATATFEIAPDTTAPHFVDSYPADGATVVPDGIRYVEIGFDEPVQRASLAEPPSLFESTGFDGSAPVFGAHPLIDAYPTATNRVPLSLDRTQPLHGHIVFSAAHVRDAAGNLASPGGFSFDTTSAATHPQFQGFVFINLTASAYVGGQTQYLYYQYYFDGISGCTAIVLIDGTEVVPSAACSGQADGQFLPTPLAAGAHDFALQLTNANGSTTIHRSLFVFDDTLSATAVSTPQATLPLLSADTSSVTDANEAGMLINTGTTDCASVGLNGTEALLDFANPLTCDASSFVSAPAYVRFTPVVTHVTVGAEIATTGLFGLSQCFQYAP